MSTLHKLKCERRFFRDVVEHRKTAEVRRNDRDFKVGDIVTIHETAEGVETGAKVCLGAITHILTHDMFPLGLQPGFVVLSFGGYSYQPDPVMPERDRVNPEDDGA